jgi:hypothetical protein
MSNQPIGDKFYLSTEGYYFEYRPDNNDRNIKRATLYRVGTNERVDDVRVSAGYGQPAKDHHQIINYFEARLTLGQIK